MEAHQAPPSLGFSRQEHWSGRVQLLPGASVHGDSPGKNIAVGCHALLQGNLANPGIKHTSLIPPAWAGGFFTTSATWEARL